MSEWETLCKFDSIGILDEIQIASANMQIIESFQMVCYTHEGKNKLSSCIDVPEYTQTMWNK